MKVSLLFPETRRPDRVRQLAADAEHRGFHGAWIGSALGIDPFVALSLAAAGTHDIQLGVAVVPTFPRHPFVMAQSAATVSAVAGGRFRLGIGPSHAPVMGMFGIDFDRPIGHLREYLTIVQTLLRDGKVQHDGERYHVNLFLDVPDAPPPPVLLGVLQARSARLAGAQADGALSWLCPATYLETVIAPNLAAGAADAGRHAPLLVAEMPCALTSDRDEVLEMAARDLAVYPHMPFYRAIFDALGIAVEGTSWNAAMVDAAVIYGDEDTLADKIRAFHDLGADEVVLSPFGVGTDLKASRANCIDVLAELARS